MHKAGTIIGALGAIFLAVSSPASAEAGGQWVTNVETATPPGRESNTSLHSRECAEAATLDTSEKVAAFQRQYAARRAALEAKGQDGQTSTRDENLLVGSMRRILDLATNELRRKEGVGHAYGQHPCP